jgi:CTP synthase (UTP-ammonia lyase)
VVELRNHPFFVGTLFVPQMRSRTLEPHPVVRGFLAAAGHFEAGMFTGGTQPSSKID